MKHFLIILAIAALGTAQSQTPAPASPAAQGSPLAQLQAIRAANATLLEQQAKAILQLVEIEKQAQQIKLLGKRS